MHIQWRCEGQPDRAGDSKYTMQFADRYVIEATNSTSAGKYINHGCPGAANARTQIMITTSEVFMGIVAKRPIAPEEEIVLDYCGACLMPPSLRNASLAQFGIQQYHCATCTKPRPKPSCPAKRPCPLGWVCRILRLLTLIHLRLSTLFWHDSKFRHELLSQRV